MHYLQHLKCLLILTARLPQISSLTRPADDGLFSAVTKNVLRFKLRRNYFMTRLSTQFVRRGTQRLSRRNSEGRARASCAILFVALMLLGVWPYSTKAMSTIAQITSTTGRFNDNPSISGDGSRIAFDSTADLTGGNPDGNREIF